MIDNQLTSIAFLLTILLLTVHEKNRLNTLVTPFTVTAWPFVVIAILVNYFLIYLGFKPVTMRVQLFILLNLIILWVVGYLIDIFIIPKGSNISIKKNDEVFKELHRYEWLIIVLSWFAIAIIIRRVFSLFNKYGGFVFIGDSRFENMMVHGSAAHMGEIAKICFVLLGIFFRFSRRRIIVFMTLFGLFISLAALQVKYHLLWVLIMLFIYNIIEMPVSKQWRALIWTGISVLLVMNLFWILLTIAWKTFSFSNVGVWKFLFDHTMLYISSSLINLEQWLNHPNIKPGSTLFSVIFNMKYIIVGNPFRYNPMPDTTIGFIKISDTILSNTGTAYGVFYIIGGPVFVLLMTVLLSVIYYQVFFQSRRNNSPYIIFMNIFFMTLATLTFFSEYFTSLSLYETIFLYIILITIFKILNYLKMENRFENQRKIMTGFCR